MTTGFVQFFKTKPIYVYLLAIFFVLHGFLENFDFVPIGDAILLTATYLFASLILVGLCWLLYRDLARASLLTFLIMCFHFFFGSMHDSLKKYFPGSFVSKYTFVLTVACIFFVAVIVSLKRARSAFLTKINAYLNLVLLLLLLIDTVLLSTKFLRGNQRSIAMDKDFMRCNTSAKPDVYFILTDEYAGNDELENLFHFDNSMFENQLKSRGFHVIERSCSNYNYTPFSMASILNMDYLHHTNITRTGSPIAYCYEQIKNSSVIRFFQENGYTFFNYSIFDFEHQPAPVHATFLPIKTRLITSQTFLSRLQRDLWFHMITLFNSRKSIRDLTYYNLRNNETIYKLTWEAAKQNSTSPKFVYTHLMMPHYPYYFDKDGRELPFGRLVEGNQVHKNDYIQYLQYTNTKILELIDQIRGSSHSPPIIVVLGDHGFRHFAEPVDRKYYFMNLSAVYLPDQDYSSLRDSSSSVNLFRSILNTHFCQHLPMLKDSTIYLLD